MEKKESYTKKKTIKRKPADSKKKRVIFISYNFSDVEDASNAFAIISDLSKRAGANAAAEAKVAGLDRTYFFKDSIINISSSGLKTVLTPKISRAKYYIKSRPGKKYYAAAKLKASHNGRPEWQR